MEWLRLNGDSPATQTRFTLRLLNLEGNYRRLMRHQEALLALSRPIHLTLAHRTTRRSARDLRCHLMMLPDGLYLCYEIERALFCSAPELIMLQMGTVLDENELLFLGYELCGCYGFDLNGLLTDRPPLCCAQEIAAYADYCSGVHGRKRVAAVAPRIIDGAASPMEAALAICLTAPVESGGLGLPFPQLNHTLPVKGTARRLWDGDTITPDLLWQFEGAEEGQLQGVAIEYDSDEEHTGSSRIARDARRRNVLEEMGYRVLTMTNEQFANTRELERIGEMVARQLGITFEDAIDEAWVARVAYHQRIRSIAMHPERLLGARR